EAPDLGRAGSLRHQPGEDVDQRRLARAVGAEQAEDAALRHVEAHVVEREFPRRALDPGIALDEIPDADRGTVAHGLLCAAGSRARKGWKSRLAVAIGQA